jgi:hypothetical protein
MEHWRLASECTTLIRLFLILFRFTTLADYIKRDPKSFNHETFAAEINTHTNKKNRTNKLEAAGKCGSLRTGRAPADSGNLRGFHGPRVCHQVVLFPRTSTGFYKMAFKHISWDWRRRR